MTIELRERMTMTPEAGRLFVRGVIGGLSVVGYPTKLQCQITSQVAQHMLGLDLDVGTIDPLDAAEILSLIPDPWARRRLVQSVVTLELLEDPTPQLARHVRKFARDLGIDEPMVTAARRA